MNKFLLSLFMLLQLSVFSIGQDQANSVVEAPAGTTVIGSSIAPVNYQETDPLATAPAIAPALVPSGISAESVTESPTKSLLGKQLNRITPNPANHSPFITAGCNCNQHVPAAQATYTTPASRLPLLGSPSYPGFPGYTSPGVNHRVPTYTPPAVYNNLPAYRPFYGLNYCHNPAGVQRVQRGGMFARRFGR